VQKRKAGIPLGDDDDDQQRRYEYFMNPQVSLLLLPANDFFDYPLFLFLFFFSTA
jgi:hypothetical protein